MNAGKPMVKNSLVNFDFVFWISFPSPSSFIVSDVDLDDDDDASAITLHLFLPCVVVVVVVVVLVVQVGRQVLMREALFLLVLPLDESNLGTLNASQLSEDVASTITRERSGKDKALFMV